MKPSHSLLALTMALTSCAQVSDRAQTPERSESVLAAGAPNYGEIHRQVMEHLWFGDMDEALELVEGLPERPPESLDDPRELHDFARLRGVADLLINARKRGATGVQIRMEGGIVPPFDSQPRT